MIGWDLVLAVHILAIALWTGGMAYALMVLRPSLAVLSEPDRLSVHQQAFARFFRLVWGAMPLTLLTGWAMVFGVYGGFAHLPWPVNAMQTLGLVMALVFLAIVFGPWKRYRAQPNAKSAASIRKLVHASLGLGGLTIVLGCLAHW